MDSSYTSQAQAGGGIGLVVQLLFLALFIISLWKLFVKAGKPGWAAIVPIYNLYVLLKVVNKPGWWLLLLCIPFVNIVIMILVSIELAKAFGKGSLFGFFLLFLFNFIGYPLLAFGSSKYQGSVEPKSPQAPNPTANPAPTAATPEPSSPSSTPTEIKAPEPTTETTEKKE